MFDISQTPNKTPLPLREWLPLLEHNGIAAWAHKLAEPMSVDTLLGERFLKADPTGPAPSGYYLHLAVETTLGKADIFLPFALFETLSSPWAQLVNPAHFAAPKSRVNAKVIPLVVEFILAAALEKFDLGIHSAEGAVVNAKAVWGATLQWFRVDRPKSHNIYIGLDDPFAQHLRDASLSEAGLYDALPVDMSLCALALWITPDELGALNRGDALGCGSATKPDFFLHVGDGTIDIKSVRKKWHPCGPHTPLVYPIKSQDTAMTDDNDFASLNVLLTFELDRRTISLAELRDQTAGSIFPVAKLDEAKIKVRANGSTIGTGRMVQFDDQLAIQILEIDGCA